MLEEPSILEVPKLQQSSGAANEQGSREQLAWLAGIIDGEGAISLVRVRHSKKKGGAIRAYHPIIFINNSDFEMIEAIALILERLDIHYHANPTTSVPPRMAERRECRYIIQLKVSGMKTCLRLLDMLHPFLVAKRRESEILRQYCARRYEEISASRPLNAVPANTIGEQYIEAIEMERAKRYDPSETICRPSYFRTKRV